MKYQLTIEITTPTQHCEDVKVTHRHLIPWEIQEAYPNFTREEFVIEMVKRLSEAYRTGKEFVHLAGMLNDEWFSIDQDINDRALCVRWYDSKYDFDNGEENDMGGIMDMYVSKNPPHDQLVSQAELALVYLTGDPHWQDEPTLQDELHVLSELWK